MADILDTESKQKYLRERIIDKGYDAGRFVQYLQTLKSERWNQL